MVKIISIEGNIGSGKSTLINQLKNKFNFNFVIYLPEPVDLWNEIKDSSGVTILEKYYKDKLRYSFSFQMMAYITRLSQIKNCIENSPDETIIITERCLYTDRYVFAKMLYDTGFIEEIEYTIYIRWFDEFKKYTEITNIIYIQTTPQVCVERIHKRNRKGEENIPLDYLESCHQYHEDWLINNPIKLLVNGNQDNLDINPIIEFVKIC